RSDRQKCVYSCEGRVHFRASTVDRRETWFGECRAVYHRLVSVVREDGVRWASRSSSQSSQAFPAVVSGSLFIVGVIFEVLVEKLSRQIRRQPLCASFCELG